MNDRHELAIAAGWHAANFYRAKKMPGLSAVLRKVRGKPNSSPERDMALTQSLAPEAR
jgi:hypothetical protein